MVSLYLFFAKLARRDTDAMQVLFWSTVTTLAVMAVSCGVKGETLIPPSPDWFVWPFALAVVAHVIGQGLIVAGVGATPAALAGLLLLIQPVTGAMIAWPLFGEALTGNTARWVCACTHRRLAAAAVDGRAPRQVRIQRDPGSAQGGLADKLQRRINTPRAVMALSSL